MCVSCGCGKLNDNHGDSRNITQTDINNAAQAAGITPQEAIQNLMDSCQNMTSGGTGSQRPSQRTLLTTIHHLPKGTQPLTQRTQRRPL